MTWPQQFCMPINPYQAYANQAFTHPIQQDIPCQTYETTNNNKRRKMYYCWTHRACYHPGKKCHNKAPGHQDNATFQNRMGGSIKNVRGIPQQAPAPQTQITWRRGTEFIHNLNKINYNLNYIYNSAVPPTLNQYVIEKPDSGASRHYIRHQYS